MRRFLWEENRPEENLSNKIPAVKSGLRNMTIYIYIYMYHSVSQYRLHYQYSDVLNGEAVLDIRLNIGNVGY